MSTAFYRIDIVYVRVDVLRIVGVIHYCNLDRDALLLGLQINHVIEEVSAMAVNVAHKFLQSLFCVEYLLLCLSVFVRTQVCQGNSYAGVEERKLAHTA